MHLTILMPSKVFLSTDRVVKVVAESARGSFGILPRRLDCLCALVPGILTYCTEDGREFHVAVDEGILTKIGDSISISVRNAVGGVALSELKKALDSELKKIDETESALRSSIVLLQGSMLDSLTGVEHGK